MKFIIALVLSIFLRAAYSNGNYYLFLFKFRIQFIGKEITEFLNILPFRIKILFELGHSGLPNYYTHFVHNVYKV